MSTTVTYGGNIIHSVSGNTSFTLNTDGNYMDGNIEVVVVEEGSSAVLGSKTISSNGSYNASDDGLDGFANVVVDVSSGGGGGGIDVSVVKTILEGRDGPTELSISEITCVRSYAFMSNTYITSINFPNASYIGSNAFNGANYITHVNLPLCETIHNNGAFTNCSRMVSVSIPICTYIGANAFNNCYSLSELIGPSVETLSKEAIARCSMITRVVLPVCKNIGSSATVTCWRLVSLYLFASTVATLSTNNFLSTPIANYTAKTGGVVGSIFVPLSLVDSYKTANRWSSYADRFVGLTDAEISTFMATL